MSKRLIALSIALLLGVLLVQPSLLRVSAQERSEACSSLVTQAMTQIGTACANMGRNTACYGFNNVSANFRAEAVPFNQPDDRTDLLQLNHIRTSPFRQAEGTWGISLMNLQANLPNLLPGQGAVMVVFGGIEVENGVEPGEAFTPPTEGVTVTTVIDTVMRASQPTGGLDPSVIADVPSGSTLVVDVSNPDRNWVRAVFGDTAGWLPRAALDSGVDLSGLPTMAADAQTPMQACFMRVGIGGTECEPAPSSVLVQGPNGTPIDLQPLATDIRIESTVLLRTWPPGDTLGDYFEIIVLSGTVKIYPDSPDEIIVPPGFIARVRLGEFVSLGIEGDFDEKLPVGEWEIRPLTQEELNALFDLESIPDNLLFYRIQLPEIIRASGVGGVIPRIIFPDPNALEAIRRACDAGLVEEDICTYLGV